MENVICPCCWAPDWVQMNFSHWGQFECRACDAEFTIERVQEVIDCWNAIATWWPASGLLDFTTPPKSKPPAGSRPLRRMATGGMLLEEPTAEERTKTGVPATGMPLRAKHVGQFGPHAAAKNAGFLVGDVIVAFDGKTDLLRETDLLAYGATVRKPGDKVTVKFLRAGKPMDLTLPLQE